MAAKKQSSKAKVTSRGVFGHMSMWHGSNIIVAAVFVLGFAGYGTWYLKTSHAATACVYQTFGETRGGQGGTCVKAIQSMLDHFKYGPYYLKSGSYYDGIFGPKTKADVVRFQNKMYINNGGGEVGSRTWRAMCYLADKQGFDDEGDFTRAGCGNIVEYIP